MVVVVVVNLQKFRHLLSLCANCFDSGKGFLMFLTSLFRFSLFSILCRLEGVNGGFRNAEDFARVLGDFGWGFGQCKGMGDLTEV